MSGDGLDGLSTYLNRRMLARLARHCRPDEPPRRAVQGLRDGRRGLLVATEHRIVWLEDRLFGARSQEMRRRLLKRVQHEDDSLLVLGPETWRIEGIRRESARAFAAIFDSSFEMAPPTRRRQADRLVESGVMSAEEAAWGK